MRTRVEIVTDNLEQGLRLAGGPGVLLDADARLRPQAPLQAGEALALVEDMMTSRALDIAARRLKVDGRSYYTISSAGHEMNAVVGAVTRPTDPAFLHYRSGAFMAARMRLAGVGDVVRDTLLSLVAAADDPVANGRHKVWGSRDAWVPPQTSTIASHLPKAFGTAFAIDRAVGMGRELDVPADAVVVCSFGDASINHAAALAGINAARYTHRLGAGAPVLFVCEDNGIGISTPTPSRWVERLTASQAYLRYVLARGDLASVHAATVHAVEAVRSTRAPVLLHLKTVRLWGHAGSDVESGYRSREQIEAAEAADPLLAACRELVAHGVATGPQLLERWHRIHDTVDAAAEALAGSPPLATRDAVMVPLAPMSAALVRAEAAGALPRAERLAALGADLPEQATAPARRTLAAHINATLHDEMARRGEMLVFGEDVALKGGVYHVTAGLQQRFGRDRVFDTLLDETTILGVAQGAALMGFLPVPEIQYLAYLHNALDQIRGEAASLPFFSAGAYRNPMVIRIASFAYQRGFGGHFHNDNAIGALRDIPGLVIATPSRGDDAARMLRTCLAMAAVDGRVVAFLEPIALYHEKDLHEAGDGAWLFDYPPPGSDPLLPPEVGVYEPEGAADVLLVSYANGLRMSLQAARLLAGEGIRARTIDLRWLNPLPLDALTDHAAEVGVVVVVDECRATGGGIADAVVAGVVERGVTARFGSVRAADSFVPLGPAADTVLVQVGEIADAVRSLLRP